MIISSTTLQKYEIFQNYPNLNADLYQIHVIVHCFFTIHTIEAVEIGKIEDDADYDRASLHFQKQRQALHIGRLAMIIIISLVQDINHRSYL